MRSRTSAECAGAHELGPATQTGLRYRHRALPELRRQLEDHRRNRRSAGNCQNPRPFGPADPRPAARASAAIRFIPNDLRNQKRLPTRADGPARSEFERAARSGTLRAPPTTTPPKPAEATLGFSSTERRPVKPFENLTQGRFRLTTRRAGAIARARKKGGLKFLYPILTPHHLMKAMASRGRACHLPAQEASYAE